jgi:hypothetical protein
MGAELFPCPFDLALINRFRVNWSTPSANRPGAPLLPLLVITLATFGAARCHAAVSDEAINSLVSAYSAQRVVSLNVGESCAFQLKSGARRVLKLIAVQEHRDSVLNLMARAEVRIEIEGKPLELVCEPYTMPTELAGLRLLADSTAGWGNVPKTVQFSLWDAADPIVDTNRFGFPLRHYRFLSHGTQCYNEPVHLGAGDGDPAGQKFYHDYGFDLAGYEGKEQVVSATEGKVASFWPSLEHLCSVVVQDTNGFYWEYAHLKSLGPGIVLNAHLDKGQMIGILGRTGPSGNFSHSHLGSYLTRHDLDTDNRDCRLNLYPWYVAAYQAQHPKGLLAVARPHRLALTGEQVLLDGSRSLAWGGARIVQWRWVLPDGSTVTSHTAQTAFDKPGAYVAALWVEDNEGNQDVDFCQIKVFSKSGPERNMPHVFMTCTPTEGIRPNTPITVRLWFQGKGGGPISLDFDDGTRIADCKPYAALRHSFDQPGVHILTAQCQAAGNPITAMLKVIVTSAQQTRPTEEPDR